MSSIIEHRTIELEASLKSGNLHCLSPSPEIPLPTIDDSFSDDDLIDEIDNVDYHFEAARLQSFRNWPVSYIEPEKMAAAGFYYIGEGDKVRCFECRVEICQWVEGDDPMVDHQRWAGWCRFMKKIPCGNVPIGVDPSTVPPSRPRGRDVCGPYEIEYRPNSGPDSQTNTGDLELPSTAKLGCLGLGRPKAPKSPQYASYDARLRTFKHWPKSLPQTADQLADAGFFHTGKGDQTLCYHCGGGLKDWEMEDDPWEEHAKWFSKCYYLLMVKGQEYVNKITGQHITPPSIEETMRMNLPSCIQKVEQPKLVEVGETHHQVQAQETECQPGPSCGTPDSGLESLSSSVGSNTGSAENLTTLKSQNKTSKPVDDARMCKICYNGELGVVFLPCGHIVACVKCAPGMTTCAVCREHVTMTVRAFLS